MQSLLALLRIRNTHPAFRRSVRPPRSPVDSIALDWTNGDAFARLDVDSHGDVRIDHVLESTEHSRESVVAWRPVAEAQA